MGYGPGGGSAILTAKSVAAPRVTRELLQEWGEAIWTAADLVEREFGNRLQRAAIKGLILGRL